MFKWRGPKSGKSKKPAATEPSVVRVGDGPGFFLTWESELRAIAAEASAWSIETGGDLFGRWSDVPTVFLATKAGPNAQRNQAHFRLDVDYLRQLSEVMASEWDLQYFGDWHSHHRLGLSAPSSGDQRRIRQVAGRNQFAGMIEGIATLDGGHDNPTIRIHPWIYNLSGQDRGPLPLRVKVLPGVSPVRQALVARRALPEQEFRGWEGVPLGRIRIGSDAEPPTLEATVEPDATMQERILAHLATALQAASGDSVENHSTPFGSVVVAKLDGPLHLAFALGAAWPMAVLEVHRLNRNDGSNKSIAAPADLVALDVQGIVEVYRSAKAGEEGAAHVDN
jgi:hypothetical protein